MISSDTRYEADEWYSVEETPPFVVGDEEYTGYLVYTNGYIQVADYSADKYSPGIYEFHIDGEYDPYVTHWMILPAAPD